MSYTLLAENSRLSRKEHRCCWCPEKIEEGRQYVDERSIYGGEFQAHKWHRECYDAMRREASEEGGLTEFNLHEHGRGSTGPAGEDAR